MMCQCCKCTGILTQFLVAAAAPVMAAYWLLVGVSIILVWQVTLLADALLRSEQQVPHWSISQYIFINSILMIITDVTILYCYDSTPFLMSDCTQM